MVASEVEEESATRKLLTNDWKFPMSTARARNSSLFIPPSHDQMKQCLHFIWKIFRRLSHSGPGKASTRRGRGLRFSEIPNNWFIRVDYFQIPSHLALSSDVKEGEKRKSVGRGERERERKTIFLIHSLILGKYYTQKYLIFAHVFPRHKDLLFSSSLSPLPPPPNRRGLPCRHKHIFTKENKDFSFELIFIQVNHSPYTHRRERHTSQLSWYTFRHFSYTGEHGFNKIRKKKPWHDAIFSPQTL